MKQHYNPQSQRIEIAEAWPHLCCKDIDGNYVWRGRSPEEKFDPLSDLNAMHEAEKVLTPEQQTDYCSQLYFVTFKPGAKDRDWQAVSATAAQRAEAFLRTLNLWTP